MALALAMLAASPPTSADEAMRAIETEDARARAQQEQSIRSLEKVLRATKPCPEAAPAVDCPVCPGPFALPTPEACASVRPSTSWAPMAAIAGVAVGIAIGLMMARGGP
jgi:hypothetical protein